MTNAILSAAQFSSGVYILFLVLILIATLILSALLILGIRRERMRFSEVFVDKGITSIAWIEKYLTKIIATSNKRTIFHLYQIDICDFDNLKKAIGDTQYENLIKEVCNVLNKILPWGIKVSLKKEDSIVMFVKNSSNVDIESLADLIIENVAKNISLASSLSVDIEINVAEISFPSGGKTAEELIKNLELAMVVSRRQGANKVAFYTAQMGNKETDEYKYYQEIKDAMKAKEFMLYYQPIVDTNNMEVFGAEALIRWQHRTMGVLPPSNFLYVMEKTGDINWVGFWCFENMVKQLVLWQNNYENRFFVGINLSERQLLNPSLADELRTIVRKNKANPTSFVMEIASFSLYFSSEIARGNIDRLHEHGFKIAIDSFGTEFSSPTKLDQLPINIIKIDKHFWNKATEKSITADIIEMLLKFSNENGVMLIPQGVEKHEEMELLRSMGFNYMQGYLFARPLDSREFISDVLLTPWATAPNTIKS